MMFLIQSITWNNVPIVWCSINVCSKQLSNVSHTVTTLYGVGERDKLSASHCNAWRRLLSQPLALGELIIASELWADRMNAISSLFSCWPFPVNCFVSLVSTKETMTFSQESSVLSTVEENLLKNVFFPPQPNKKHVRENGLTRFLFWVFHCSRFNEFSDWLHSEFCSICDLQILADFRTPLPHFLMLNIVCWEKCI